MPAQLKVFEGPDVYREQADAWHELLLRTEKKQELPSFFLQRAWLQTWAEHYGNEKRLFLVVAENEDGQWIGGLPLVLGIGRVGRFKVPKLEMAGSPLVDCIGIPAVDRRARAETLKLILQWSQKEMKDWVAFEMREIPVEDQVAEEIPRQAGQVHLPVFTKVCSKAPLLDLEEFDESGQKVSKNLRSNLKRRTKKLEKEGQVEKWFGFPGAEELDTLFRECCAVEAASWKADGEARLLEGDSKPFIRSLWDRLSGKGDLAVGTIRLDGKLIAFHWGFRSNENRFLSYNLAYDSDFHNFSPGTLLMHHMAETGSSIGFQFLDASRGGLDHAHLLERYHGGSRQHMSATFYAPSFKARSIQVLRHSLMPAARRVQERIRAMKPPTTAPTSA